MSNMTGHVGSKANLLTRLIPDGLFVDASWLEKHGYSRSLRHYYVSTGWLEQPAHGLYRRPGPPVRWEHVVVSLQSLLDRPVSVGGRTALELQGYAHYLPHTLKRVHLYWDTPPPGWLHKLALTQVFVCHHRKRLFPEVEHPDSHAGLAKSSSSGPQSGLLSLSSGKEDQELIVSTAERAYLELLDELPKKESFDIADRFMETLATLSPRRLQRLLEETQSIKVKRLFFFFADRHQHRWLAHLDKNRIDLGKGKRMLVAGGHLDKQYQITVPSNLEQG
jgi:hypothetical protein